jgi:hypothetical protein
MQKYPMLRMGIWLQFGGQMMAEPTLHHGFLHSIICVDGPIRPDCCQVTKLKIRIYHSINGKVVFIARLPAHLILLLSLLKYVSMSIRVASASTRIRKLPTCNR